MRSLASFAFSSRFSATISLSLWRFFSQSWETAALYFCSLSLVTNIFLMPAWMTDPCLRCYYSALRMRFRIRYSPSSAFFYLPKRQTSWSRYSFSVRREACCSPPLRLPKESFSRDCQSLACYSLNWSRLSRSAPTTCTNRANSSSSACRLSLILFSSFSQASSKLASNLARLPNRSSLPPLNLRSSSSQYLSRQHRFSLHSASAWSLLLMASSNVLSAFFLIFNSFSQLFFNSYILIQSSFLRMSRRWYSRFCYRISFSAMMVDSGRGREGAPLPVFLLMGEKGTRIEKELLPLYIIITDGRG